MSDGFANFINTVTGEVVRLPAHYASLFDTLELTDQDVDCIDCNVPKEVEAEPTEAPFSAPAEISITEPARRTRRNR